MAQPGIKDGGKHEIKLYDGGAGCSTCPGTPVAVQLQEHDGAYFCAREMLERLMAAETLICAIHADDKLELTDGTMDRLGDYLGIQV